MPSLQTLSIWLGHRQSLSPEFERRPWDSTRAQRDYLDNEPLLERRHDKFFELLGNVQGVKEFTLHLTWNPIDVLERRECRWPFQVKLWTSEAMRDVISLGKTGFPHLSMGDNLSLLGF